MGWLLVVVGLAGFVVGALALAKGFSSKLAAILLLGSWVALFEGATIAGAPAENRASEPAASPSPSPSPSPQNFALLSNATPRPAGVPAQALDTLISRHVDGDTIWVGGGKLPPGGTAIRLIGVDSPELTACQGEEAAAFTSSELPAGSTIYLLASTPDKDASGRLLRYAWTDRGELFNERLAREGLAKVMPNLPDDEHAGKIRSAEADAKAAGIGVWGACEPKPKASPSPRPSPKPAAAVAIPSPPAPKSACEPSIPDFCVAPRPPDLDCNDIGRTNFRVLEPDPHHLDDGGTPGIGCETEEEEPSLFGNRNNKDSDSEDGSGNSSSSS
jgi:endonuclease YncB( thermonuclease family)